MIVDHRNIDHKDSRIELDNSMPTIIILFSLTTLIGIVIIIFIYLMCLNRGTSNLQ